VQAVRKALRMERPISGASALQGMRDNHFVPGERIESIDAATTGTKTGREIPTKLTR
jgi:hypothetical protein